MVFISERLKINNLFWVLSCINIARREFHYYLVTINRSQIFLNKGFKKKGITLKYLYTNKLITQKRNFNLNASLIMFVFK